MPKNTPLWPNSPPGPAEWPRVGHVILRFLPRSPAPAVPQTGLVFVTGRRGASSHSPDPALTRGPGGYVSGNPRPAPVRGPPALIPWTGPRLLPPIFKGDPSGVWVGRGPVRGQGQGMSKKTPRPRPLSGAGRGKGRGPAFFGAPSAP